MKNNKTKILAIILAIAFTGCAQNTPKPSQSNIMEANHIEGETITMEEEMAWQDTGIPAQMGAPMANTSEDGFQSAYFGFDQYSVTMQMNEVIRENINNAKNNTDRIKIEGNCDSYGTAEYNYALGLKRAKAIKDAMAMGGIDENRMVIVSMGESNPACIDSMTKDCMSKNRRADIKLIK